MKTNRYKWSNFLLRVENGDEIILKSGLTGAVVIIDPILESQINEYLNTEQSDTLPAEIEQLSHHDTSIIVHGEMDEFTSWQEKLVDRRNNDAHIFILHFLPTIQCQLRCSYCFENGADRGVGMKPDILATSKKWAAKYIADHPEIDMFRLIIFGGEPLLQKDTVRDAVASFHSIANARGIGFQTEMVTNGEFLDEETARILSEHNWKRVQITLDGPKRIHDIRRHGQNGRPTFDNIMNNIKMLVTTNYIPKIDLRMSFDRETADHLPELIKDLASLGACNRINLSLGFITSTFAKPTEAQIAEIASEKALYVWSIAKEYGFEVPEEFVTGPWCVAIAKHGAVLQPDGALQKCFCSAGRKDYNFSDIKKPAGEYLRDARFEHFTKRTEDCVKEKCQFLPLCGGGCIHDAMVENGGPDGGQNRICQKNLLDLMNHGLLKLAHS